MTADVYEMDFTLLNELIRKMYNIASVGYVFYDITTKPPATIEWE
jgi:GMP synthase PP-ATPase subunit